MLFLPKNEPGQKLLARLERTQNTGKALIILAQKLGRAVYDLRKRHTACAMETFLKSEGSRAGEPDASLDTQGTSLKRAHGKPNPAAFLNASVY